MTSKNNVHAPKTSSANKIEFISLIKSADVSRDVSPYSRRHESFLSCAIDVYTTNQVTMSINSKIQVVMDMDCRCPVMRKMNQNKI